LPSAIFDPNNVARGEKPLKYAPGFLRKFLISLPSRHRFENDIGAFYGKGPDDLSVAIVLDLQRLSRLFVERSPRPLVTVMSGAE
jgi:hypothetical protein